MADEEDDDNDDDSTTNSQDDKELPMDSQILQVGRAAYGRSIITPVKIPFDLMKEAPSNDNNENRPHCTYITC